MVRVTTSGLVARGLMIVYLQMSGALYAVHGDLDRDALEFPAEGFKVCFSGTGPVHSGFIDPFA